MRQIHNDSVRGQQILLLSKQLQEINQERRNLAHRLEELDVQAEAVNRKIATLHNLDAPISILSDEMLAVIFRASVDVEGSSRFIEVLSHVSHRWRNILLDTPSLWANLCFPEERMGWKDTKLGWKDRAVTYLSRSKSTPVKIHIHLLRERDPDLDFFDAIGSHMGHCSQLYIDWRISDNYFQALLGSLLCRAVPILTSFTFAITEIAVRNQQEQLFPFGAPALTTVELDGITSNCRLLRSISVFSSLSSLRIFKITFHDRENYEQLRDGLMSLRSLRYLELGLDRLRRRPEDLKLKPIILPSIQVLRISNHDFYLSQGESPIPQILACIQAISLMTISLKWYRGEHRLFRQHEINFPSLLHLSLADVPNHEVPDLMDLSYTFPDIERFTWHVSAPQNPCDILVRILRHVDGSADQSRWPRLHTVEISTSIQAAYDPMLLSMILELQRPTHPVKKLRVPGCFFDTAVPEILATLRELVELEVFRDDWSPPFEGMWC